MSAVVPSDYSDRYDPDLHVDSNYTDETAVRIAEVVVPGQRVLELGSSTGRMSAVLVDAGAELVGMEWSERYLERARERLAGRATFVHGDVEGEWPDLGRFHHVVATNLVQEVRDPRELLRRAASVLEPGGIVHVSTQNPRSIHRLLGQAMQMIDRLDAVTAEGQSLGTQQIFDRDQLDALAAEVGLVPCRAAGIVLKPLPNGLMATLPPEILRGLAVVGRQFPEHCAMNYVGYHRG